MQTRKSRGADVLLMLSVVCSIMAALLIAACVWGGPSVSATVHPPIESTSEAGSGISGSGSGSGEEVSSSALLAGLDGESGVCASHPRGT